MPTIRTVPASEIANDKHQRLLARIFVGPTDREMKDQQNRIENLKNRLAAAERKLTQMKKDRDSIRRLREGLK